jgi:hypothetical protein
MELLIMQLPQSACYSFLHFQHSFSDTLNLSSSLHVTDEMPHPYKYFNLYVSRQETLQPYI